MSVRRGATRFATVLTLLAGLVAVGAAPAAAADDNVEIRLPSRFTAGGDGGSVSVAVTKRTDGCVSVLTALAIRLEQLPADQVSVKVSREGEWREVSVSSAGDGLVVTERTSPGRELCRKRSVSVRYRVTFLKGAPGGEATLVAEAYTGGGGLIDRAAGTREVINRYGFTPRPTNSPTESSTLEDTEVPAPQSTSAAPGLAGGQSDSGSFFGIGTVVMLLGVAMVGLGVALLVLLLRRARTDGDESGPAGYLGRHLPPPPPTGGGAPQAGSGAPQAGGGPPDHPTLIIPRVPPR